jgi:hypothetical protein
LGDFGLAENARRKDDAPAETTLYRGAKVFGAYVEDQS